MARESDILYGMGFRLIERDGFARADLKDGVCLILEKMKRAGWRCVAAMPCKSGATIRRFAAFPSDKPSEAAKGCLLVASLELAKRKSSLESETRRIERAMEAIEETKEKLGQRK